MTTSRFARLRALFEAHKDRPAEERDAAVRGAATEDPSLAADLARLFSAHDRDSSALERPAFALLGLADDGPDPWLGRTIGSYVVEEVLGRGGMGVVYRATSDAPSAARREVALKVVRGPLDQDRARRLEREARLLAELAHPAIVPVLDQGRTDDGAPWFAMEKVDGVPLDRFTTERAVPRSERLRLFLELADAVQHAHERGVVHRDLKPSNVLVVAGEDVREAHVRVLDFGLAARATGLERTLSTRFTEPGRLLGTLAYMSPEQARSEDVDQRSDVYALGAILHELLTGRRPIDLSGTTLVEAMERIAETTPPPPRSLDRSIGRDLSAVVTTALAKDPARRYPSAAALADDLRRALAGEPVLARPPSLPELIARAILRHKAASAAAAALLVVALAAGARAAAKERAHANALARERAEAEAIARFQERLFEGDAPGGGDDPRLADLLDRAVALAGEELAGRPSVEAAVRHTLGRTYDALGLHAEAAPLLERARELRAAAFGEADPATRDTRHALAVHLLRRGEPLASADEFARLEADARAALGEECRERYVHLAGRATGLRYAARLEEAEALYREAVAGLTRVAGEDDVETLRAEDGLVSTLRLAGSLDEAEALLEDLLPRARRVLGEDAEVTQAAISNRTRFLQTRGRLDEAEALQSDVLERRRRALGDDHPLVLTALNNLASIRHAAGRFGEAAEAMEDVVRRKEAALGRGHPSTLTSLGNLAVLRAAAGRVDEALLLLDEVLLRQRETLGEDSYVTLGTRNVRAQLLVSAGRPDEGLAAARDAAEASLRVLGGAHPDTLMAWSNLGALLRNLERLDEAVEVLETTVRMCDEAAGPRSSEAQWARYNLAVTLRKASRTDDSLARFEELRAIPAEERTQENGFEHLLQVGYGNVLHELGREEEAAVALEAGLAGLKALLGPGHPRTLEAARSLALVYAALGRAEDQSRMRAFVERGGLEE